MSEISMLFGGLEGSVPEYDQESLKTILSIVKNGSGIIQDDDTDNLIVRKTGVAGLNSVVGTGKFWDNGFLYINDSDLTKGHSVGHDTNDRYDRVVVQFDELTDKEAKIIIKEGLADGNNLPPELTRTDTVREYSLYKVRIQAGYTSATVMVDDDFIDEREDTTVCGYYNDHTFNPSKTITIVGSAPLSNTISTTKNVIDAGSKIYWMVGNDLTEFDNSTITESTLKTEANIDFLLGFYNSNLYFKDTSNNIKYFDFADSYAVVDSTWDLACTVTGFMMEDFYYWKSSSTKVKKVDMSDGTVSDEVTFTGIVHMDYDSIIKLLNGQWISIGDSSTDNSLYFYDFEEETNSKMIEIPAQGFTAGSVKLFKSGGVYIISGARTVSGATRYEILLYSIMDGELLRIGDFEDSLLTIFNQLAFVGSNVFHMKHTLTDEELLSNNWLMITKFEYENQRRMFDRVFIENETEEICGRDVTLATDDDINIVVMLEENESCDVYINRI